jgi:large-conductance mechanosensitive channel
MDSDQTPSRSLQEELFKTQCDLENTNLLVRDFSNQRRQTATLFRGTGYALLLVTLVLYVNFFIPPAFGNPVWQLQLVGNLVQNLAFPVVGLTLVLYGGRNWRLRQELALVQIFSYATLIVALLFFMLLPLSLSSTVRLYNQGQAEVVQGLDQRLSAVQRVETQVKQATSDAQISQLVNQLKVQAPSGISPQQLKDQMLVQLTQAKSKLQAGAELQRQEQRFSVIKNFIQQALIAIIATGIFVWLWWISAWARVRLSRSTAK